MRISNPLRKYNTYNYIVTLGCISKDSYNARKYRSTGLDNIILRSGGGKYSKRVRTAEEELLGEDLEYFIEDLEIDAVIAPNQNTGISLGTTINFKVIEPYSMSQFIEALQVAANASGYFNYINASFCLKIEFVGWDELGRNSVPLSEIPATYIPIKLIDIKFSVTGNGSEYEVKALPFGEVATFDTYNTSLVQIGANGFSVSDVLENANNSVTGIMNDHIEQLEERGEVPQMHRYLILFPKKEDDIIKVITNGADVDIDSLRSDIESEQATLQGTGEITAEIVNATDAILEDFTGAPPIYRMLKAYSLNQNNINVIGKSPIKNDSNEGSNQNHVPASSAVGNNGRVARNNPEGEPVQNSRRFDYSENTKITDIIGDVILSSAYIQETLKKIENPRGSENGKYPWFRIEPMTFVEKSGVIENDSGSTVNTYVFAVHPFFIDEAKILGPASTPTSTDILKNAAPKEYDYFYTGKNEDVLAFDINYNFAFFNAIGGDLASIRTPHGADVTGNSNTKTSGISNRVTDKPLSDQTGSVVLTPGVSPTVRGSRDGRVSENERRRAEAIHSRILNSNVDMVQAELEIWGDPYFIPNYQGSDNASGFLISNDRTMRYLRDEVIIVVNFRSPLDYQINGSLMNFPQLVPSFSGLYNVWAVTNEFSQGKFTQTLKLTRRQGQTNDTESRPTTKTLDERDAARTAEANESAARILNSGAFDGVRIEPGTTRGGPSRLRQRLAQQNDPNRTGPQ